MSTYNFVLGLSDFDSGTVYFAGTTTPFAIRKGGYRPTVAPSDEPFLDESIQVRLIGGSVQANLSQRAEVDRLLLQANRRQGNKTLSPVYVFFKRDPTATQYRSEVIDGRAEWETSAFDREYWDQNTQYAEIEWTRGNWWEGPEAQIPLTNLNGTANTSGLTVYNTNDLAGTAPTRQVNYVAIAGTAVVGDLDGLTRLEIKNTFATHKLGYAWIGHSYTNPATLTHFFDTNSATAASGGSAVSNGLASGGSYVDIPLVSGTEADLLTWTLTSTQLDAFAGRMYKALLRWFGGVDTNIRYRLQLKWRGSTIWSSSLVSLLGAPYGTLFRDLATFKLPPWVAGLSNQDEMQLVLRGLTDSGGTVTTSIDNLQLLPVDGWRHIAYVSSGGGTLNHRVIDDGINGRLYEDDGAGGSIAAPIVGYGRPIALRPDVDQRLYITSHTNLFEIARITHTLQVKVYYRPRWRSL